ncbi:hypothetical protein GQ85_41920, partial [Rhodococcus rhodochrous]
RDRHGDGPAQTGPSARRRRREVPGILRWLQVADQVRELAQRLADIARAVRSRCSPKSSWPSV